MNQPVYSRGGIAFQVANGPFGSRLRLERERRRITLDSIAANTKISVRLLIDLERDNVSRWPTGIFGRSFIKAYAQAIGLDPDEVAREFLERFPGHDTSGRSQEDCPTTEPGPSAATTQVRLTLVRAEGAFTRGSILQAARSRGSAAVWDIGVAIIAAGSSFVLLGQFWRPLGIFMLAYYTGGILLLGNTPGVCLLAAGPSSRRYSESAWSDWAVMKLAVIKARMRALVDRARRTRGGRRTLDS
jgi:transcriptional regulator with XRE-family HTH domain